MTALLFALSQPLPGECFAPCNSQKLFGLTRQNKVVDVAGGSWLQRADATFQCCPMLLLFLIFLQAYGNIGR